MELRKVIVKPDVFKTGPFVISERMASFILTCVIWGLIDIGKPAAMVSLPHGIIPDCYLPMHVCPFEDLLVPV